MKLCERIDYNRLHVSTDIKEPLNTQGFSQYAAPITGIEVEVENFTNPRDTVPKHSWHMENDGSLRNHGIEFISKPTKPEHIESAITYLFDEILNKQSHFSPRTSIHVHMNCRDLTFDQLYNIVILYQCFEDLLYNFAGKERKKSIFCIPIGNTNYYNNFKQHIRAHELLGWSKYTGLNLGPLREYGTIEFRHLRGTRNKHILFEWLHILYKLYNFAITVDTKQLENLITETADTQDYGTLGIRVFGSHFMTLTRDTLYQKNMKEDLAISKLFMFDRPNLKGFI